jgi:hypothetical protein
LIGKYSSELPAAQNEILGPVPVRPLPSAVTERKLINIACDKALTYIGGRGAIIGGDVVYVLDGRRAFIERMAVGVVHQEGRAVTGAFFQVQQHGIVARRACI